ncbi:MAG: rhodanese-related sulfurtransferase [Legionellaceae bacterium]|nr:rhodanese-related sulfurtransferase [Legionellaceae bacterium]
MPTNTHKYIIANFYKFVGLEDYESLREPLLNAMKQHQILGTVLLAKEGINGGFAGEPEKMACIYDYLKQDPRLADLTFKESFDDLMPFEKAKVKLRKEIVTLGVPGIDPLQQTGTRVKPEEWNSLISDPNVVVVDTRNTYEFDLGSFKNAINPETENFRDFPKYVEENLLDKKDKKIAMFCTGGIRCEKSTAYLMDLGFKNVYQLEGGILDYFKDIPTKESMWEGGCFVFDERITIDGHEGSSK